MKRDVELVPGFYDETDETLELRIERIEGVERGMLFRMSGYLDGFNVAFFSKQVEKVVRRGYLFLSFDLKDIRYVSSRGIGVFSSFLKILRARGGDILLFGIRPRILEVFRILGVFEYFTICGTREEASAVFRNKPAPPAAAAFPLRSQCPVCGQALELPGAGRGRCPGCKCPLVIDRRGRVAAGTP